MGSLSITSARTLIVRAAVRGTDEDVIRQLGVMSTMGFDELHRILGIAFNFDTESENAPWSFISSLSPVLPDDNIGDFLLYVDDELEYSFGLWTIELRLLDIYPRDNDTPEALCIGASGSLNHREVDISAINVALTGRETTETILSQVHEAVRSVIERSGMFDFIPLLQAMDLTRPSTLDKETVQRLRHLPKETDPAAVDAFWSMVLALSSLGGDDLATDIVETVMDRLGWEDDDGSFLTGPKIRDLCDHSLFVLSQYKAYGPQLLNPLDRLDIYRELLRRE